MSGLTKVIEHNDLEKKQRTTNCEKDFINVTSLSALKTYKVGGFVKDRPIEIKAAKSDFKLLSWHPSF